jgi:hypothetical protein
VGRVMGQQYSTLFLDRVPNPWFDKCKLNRRSVTSICRLRSGHTALTHSQSESESHCNWRSVSLSVMMSSPVRGSWPDIYSSVKVTVLSIRGALSDERSGLSFVSHSHWFLSIVSSKIITILEILTSSMYNIYKASVSTGSVQKTMPYF